MPARSGRRLNDATIVSRTRDIAVKSPAPGAIAGAPLPRLSQYCSRPKQPTSSSPFTLVAAAQIVALLAYVWVDARLSRGDRPGAVADHYHRDLKQLRGHSQTQKKLVGEQGAMGWRRPHPTPRECRRTHSAAPR